MFSSLLPKPKYSEYDPFSKRVLVQVKKKDFSKQLVTLPASSASKLPTTIIEDSSNNGRITKLHLNPDGTLNYQQTIASASANLNRKVQASYEDTIPLKVRFPNLKHHFPRYDLESCPDDSLKNCVNETREVVNKLMNSKLGVDEDSKNKKDKVQYVKYFTNTINDDDDDRGRERTIQIRDYQEDPMLPPKFKLRKNRHKNPSPPPPILKNTNNEIKLTKEDKDKWNIPSAISNWKNNQGFTISLDKRMLAASGGSNISPQEISIEKFGKLSEALENADKEAREEIRIRNEMLKELALKEQREKELKLKELADLTRYERHGNSKRSHTNHYNESNKRTKY